LHLLDEEVIEAEMDRTFSMHWGDENYVHGFGRKTLKEETAMET
jgi:hypothetical protein